MAITLDTGGGPVTLPHDPTYGVGLLCMGLGPVGKGPTHWGTVELSLAPSVTWSVSCDGNASYDSVTLSHAVFGDFQLGVIPVATILFQVRGGPTGDQRRQFRTTDAWTIAST